MCICLAQRGHQHALLSNLLFKRRAFRSVDIHVGCHVLVLEHSRGL